MKTTQPRQRASQVLTWLADKRARLSGHEIYLQEQIKRMQVDLDDVTERRKAMDITIREYSELIDVMSIAPIKPQGDRVAFGTRVDAIRSTLTRHAGQWVSTTSVTLECAVLLGVDLSNSNVASEFRHVILKELGQQASRGLVQRKHPLQTTQEGYWCILHRPLTALRALASTSPFSSGPLEQTGADPETGSLDPDGGRA